MKHIIALVVCLLVCTLAHGENSYTLTNEFHGVKVGMSYQDAWATVKKMHYKKGGKGLYVFYGESQNPCWNDGYPQCSRWFLSWLVDDSKGKRISHKDSEIAFAHSGEVLAIKKYKD